MQKKATISKTGLLICIALLCLSTSRCMVFPQHLTPKVKKPMNAGGNPQPLQVKYDFTLGESRLFSGILLGGDDAIQALNGMGPKFGYQVERVPPQVDPAEYSIKTGKPVHLVSLKAIEDASSSAVGTIILYVFWGIIPWRSSVHYELKADTYVNGKVTDSYFFEDEDAIWMHLIFLIPSPVSPSIAQGTLDNIVAAYYEKLAQTGKTK